MKRRHFQYDYILAIHLALNQIIDILQVYKFQQITKKKGVFENNNIISIGSFILLFMIKYQSEGARPNSLFLIFAELFLILSKQTGYQYIIFPLLAILMTIIYIFSIYYFPVYKFPKNSGIYSVGYKTFRLDDERKTEVSVFYPAANLQEQKQRKVQQNKFQPTVEKKKNFLFNNNSENKDPAIINHEIEEDEQAEEKKRINYVNWLPYPEYWHRIYLTTQWTLSNKKSFLFIPQQLFKFIFSYFKTIKFEAEQDQLISQLQNQKQRYKVIIFSHGLAGNRNCYTTYTNELASKGYIVFSIEHYEPIILKELNSNQTIEDKFSIMYEKRTEYLNDRINQITKLLDCLCNDYFIKVNIHRDVLIDIKNIVIMGHSYGGITAIWKAINDDRIKAAIAIDPWVFPKGQELIQKKCKKPLLIINSETFYKNVSFYKLEETLKQFYDLNKDYVNNKLICNLQDTDHLNFCDQPFIMPRELKLFHSLRKIDNIEQPIILSNKLIELFLENFVYSGKQLDEDSRLLYLIDPFEEFCKKELKIFGKLKCSYLNIQ